MNMNNKRTREVRSCLEQTTTHNTHVTYINWSGDVFGRACDGVDEKETMRDEMRMGDLWKDVDQKRKIEQAHAKRSVKHAFLGCNVRNSCPISTDLCASQYQVSSDQPR